MKIHPDVHLCVFSVFFNKMFKNRFINYSANITGKVRKVGGRRKEQDETHSSTSPYPALLDLISLVAMCKVYTHT